MREKQKDTKKKSRMSNIYLIRVPEKKEKVKQSKGNNKRVNRINFVKTENRYLN